MDTKIPNRIHIIGSVGSGKTTLARKLSAQFNLPYYELDNVVWERAQPDDIRRSEADRDALLLSIVNTNGWIIEGAHLKWVSPSFRHADLIVFLNPSYSTITYRIITRFIKQRLRLEQAHYTPTWDMFKKMFDWSASYQREGRYQIQDTLADYPCKVVVVRSHEQLMQELKQRMPSIEHQKRTSG
ncbi:DNA topology modulation protein FlaR [Paenibacillus lautus]|uniref:DNA topology modulation protein FlaR n=1 Tax=Paenibacillus lautus TaxID=1401 RepID=A0A385TVS4_PAELA|nr:DNA topology modulation protein FlaR [Paenibacillus lautus]AYB47573.1 DNA topology modulation protein FlaR [Paenibacillus lautus]VTR18584.1 topology modulation protein [Actinobacillus pleuropneumoniae]